MSTRNGYKFYWLAVPSQRRGCATFIPVPLYHFYNELTIDSNGIGNNDLNSDCNEPTSVQ